MRSLSLKSLYRILALSFLFQVSAYDPALPATQTGQSREESGRYNDDFRELNEDVWEKSDGDNGFFLAQMGNFKLADMRVQEGKLIFETKTGCFSSAGLNSKFAFRGDFDIQVDCRVDFLDGANEMDQIAVFSVMDGTPGFKEGELDFVNFGVSKERGKPAGLYTTSLMKGTFKLSKWKRMDRFAGSFRLKKDRDFLDVLYKKEGDATWTPFDSIMFDKKITTIAIGARNCAVRLLDSLQANSVFTAHFARFRVNTAQEILGPEAFQTPAMELSSLRIQNSLPGEKLAPYNDTFNGFKEDLWEKGGAFFEAQTEDFKLADIRIQDGRLVIETKTGGFSSGGIGAKFKFKGDFDVQVDCRVDFTKDAEDMDQILIFHVIDPTEGLKDEEIVGAQIGVAKSRGKPAGLFSTSLTKGEVKFNRGKKIDRFRGSLRMVKSGTTLYAFYRNEGTPIWKSFGAFPFDSRETGISLQARNFEMRKAGSIGAKTPFTGTFDNFRVNAAQEIIEPEI